MHNEPEVGEHARCWDAAVRVGGSDGAVGVVLQRAVPEAAEEDLRNVGVSGITRPFLVYMMALRVRA